MSHVFQAFQIVIPDAIERDIWFVSIVEEVRRHAGYEEGGWWVTDQTVVAYKEYPSKELAERAVKQIEQMASELEHQATLAHGKHCAESMKWLEQRGLEADFMPEPDGAAKYRVVLSQEIPEDVRPSRTYE
jgi:hypothetical protein